MPRCLHSSSTQWSPSFQYWHPPQRPQKSLIAPFLLICGRNEAGRVSNSGSLKREVMKTQHHSFHWYHRESRYRYLSLFNFCFAFKTFNLFSLMSSSIMKYWTLVLHPYRWPLNQSVWLWRLVWDTVPSPFFWPSPPSMEMWKTGPH